MELKPDFPVERYRADFPILHQSVEGHALAYLDNAATTQKPQCVLDALQQYYAQDNANVHRGVHTLSERATAQYEAARDTVKSFINAAHREEIIFVRSATEAINLVAQSYVRTHANRNSQIVVTAMEHHANIVPWQLACEYTHAELKVIPMNESGELILDDIDELLSDNTTLLAVGHVSNALGTINPIKTLIDKAKAKGIPVLIDGAQAVHHMPVDVQALDCDFYVFSGHKTYGPTGIGVLYGKRDVLNSMPPYQGGGDMIRTVSFTKTTYSPLPTKFEAGTPHIAGAVGLARALTYLNDIGLDKIAAYEAYLTQYAHEVLRTVPGLKFIGTASEKTSVVSFVIDKCHPHDIGTILSSQGIAIRSGHHCAMPVMEFYDLPATARASFSFYNTTEEIDRLVEGLLKVKEVLG